MVEFRKIGLYELYKVRKIAYETWPGTFGQFLPKEQIEYMLQLFYNEESWVGFMICRQVKLIL